MQNRENELQQWLINNINIPISSLTALPGDASFRRYYRLYSQDKRFIIMDAPPAKEPIDKFLKVARDFAACNLRVPQIFAVDQQQGFILLEDFGDTLLSSVLNDQNVDIFYQCAVDELLKLQNNTTLNANDFAAFDEEFMLKEMGLMPHWFLEGYLKYSLSAAEIKMLEQTFKEIAQHLANQPQTFIHRDYHSRNLMVLSEKPVALGVIDFQDAMYGPYTYDLLSFLKDCYISWPRQKQLAILGYYSSFSPHGELRSFQQMQEDFDICGLQRHIKVLGIFSRLYLRDHKSGYLKDIPLTLKYILDCLESTGWWPEFFELMQRITLK